jgi:hypothetical protein
MAYIILSVVQPIPGFRVNRTLEDPLAQTRVPRPELRVRRVYVGGMSHLDRMTHPE